MLADPQSVTISGSAISLPRTSSGINSGVFTAADGTAVMSVSHQYGRRIRRVIRLDHNKIAPDPLISAQNIKHSMGLYIVADVPVTGFVRCGHHQVSWW
jgi:hypothetical protein